MSRSFGTVAAVAIVVGLAGCSGSPSESDSTSRAESLWSSRTPYVGDNPAVAALVSDVHPAPRGEYSIRLRTDKHPYALTIELDRPDQPFDPASLERQATLLLGLVANLDTVSITSGKRAYSLTAVAASEDLGYDVKDLGGDQSRLDAYLGVATH